MVKRTQAQECRKLFHFFLVRLKRLRLHTSATIVAEQRTHSSHCHKCKEAVVVYLCVSARVCVCVWICGKARACLFNSADSGLLEDLGEVVNNVSGQNTCANTSNKPRCEETADFYLGHLFCCCFQLCLSNFYWCTS